MIGKPCTGYTLLCYAGPEGRPTLIDMLGEVVHQWSIASSFALMLPGGSILGGKRGRGTVDPSVPPPPPPSPKRPQPGGRRQGPPPNPLAQETANKASFAGSLRLNGVKLNSTTLLSSLLSVMRVKEREFDLGDQTIDFVARDGRLECSPLTIDVGGSPLVMYGSVGFDNTLDYIAQIPLTENMVGKDAYRFLPAPLWKIIDSLMKNSEILCQEILKLFFETPPAMSLEV